MILIEILQRTDKRDDTERQVDDGDAAGQRRVRKDLEDADYLR
jgi:hypothetical protein